MELNIFFQIMGYVVGMFSLYLHLNLKIKTSEMRLDAMDREIKKIDKILENSDKILLQQTRNNINIENLLNEKQRKND